MRLCQLGNFELRLQCALGKQVCTQSATQAVRRKQRNHPCSTGCGTPSKLRRLAVSELIRDAHTLQRNNSLRRLVMLD